jgi:hypothetical protein
MFLFPKWGLDANRDMYSCIPLALKFFFLTFQGGNNIHSRGVTAIAETLKENTVLTTVSLIITQTISLQERRYVH